jgi:catechol-2,3-dioxygenase
MSALRLTRLNHAVLFVTDLERAVYFYTSVLGMDVVSREPKFNATFLRIPQGGNHHDLGLFGLGPAARPPVPDSVGLYHLAWQVNTIDDLAEARDTLANAQALRGESSHGATKSLYGVDPDGNQFEIMWMLPREHWGAYADKTTVEPLDLGGELQRWSGVGTAR